MPPFKKVELTEFEDSDIEFKMLDCVIDKNDSDVSLYIELDLCKAVRLTCVVDDVLNCDVIDGALINMSEMLDYEVDLCSDWICYASFDNLTDYVMYRYGEEIEGYIKDSIQDYNDEKELAKDSHAYYGVNRWDF